jgi:UDP-N-acetyl-D-mannosaminuronic acid dehydrogenase
VLEFKADGVLCADPYVKVDPGLLPQEEVIARSDLLIIATPHQQYRGMTIDKPVADIWNVLGQGVHV